MKTELEALLADAVLETTSHQERPIKDFIHEHARELTSSELAAVTILGILIHDIGDQRYDLSEDRGTIQ